MDDHVVHEPPYPIHRKSALTTPPDAFIAISAIESDHLWTHSKTTKTAEKIPNVFPKLRADDPGSSIL
jgi:hypothetical protein